MAVGSHGCQDTLADKEVLMSEELRAALNQYLVMRKDRPDIAWGQRVGEMVWCCRDGSCGQKCMKQHQLWDEVQLMMDLNLESDRFCQCTRLSFPDDG